MQKLLKCNIVVFNFRNFILSLLFFDRWRIIGWDLQRKKLSFAAKKINGVHTQKSGYSSFLEAKMIEPAIIQQSTVITQYIFCDGTEKCYSKACVTTSKGTPLGFPWFRNNFLNGLISFVNEFCCCFESSKFLSHVLKTILNNDLIF